MTVKPTGGPAFPLHAQNEDHLRWSEYGMTLRDWFAGQALTGLLAHSSGEDPKIAPQVAYELADAMLAEREKKP